MPYAMYFIKITINCFFFFSIATIMRASGCDVPDYMLAMKKHSKKERRKLERTAPTRERILTIPKRHKRKSHKEKQSEAKEEI